MIVSESLKGVHKANPIKCGIRLSLSRKKEKSWKNEHYIKKTSIFLEIALRF
jgi:hypothetical protein